MNMSVLLTKSCRSLFMISYHLLYQWLNLNHLWRQLVHFLLLNRHFFYKVISSGLVSYIVNFLLIRILSFLLPTSDRIFCLKFRFFLTFFFYFNWLGILLKCWFFFSKYKHDNVIVKQCRRFVYLKYEFFLWQKYF